MPFNENYLLKPSEGNGHYFECREHQEDSMKDIIESLRSELCDYFELDECEFFEETVIEYDCNGNYVNEHFVYVTLEDDEKPDNRSDQSIFGAPRRL